MKRLTPILLALGLACLVGQLDGDFGVDTQAAETGSTTLLMLALGLSATVLGCVNLLRRRI